MNGAHRKPDGAAAAKPTTAELKEDIERTRADLADTVEALAYKADIPSRMKDRARATSATVKQRTSQMTEQAMAKLPPPAREKAEHAVAAARSNPKQMAVVLGMLLTLWVMLRRGAKRKAADE